MAKILILDDEIAFREAVAETIRDLGHECETVGTTSQAIEVLTNDRVELLLVDFRMPVLNGIEAIRLIKDKMGDRTPPFAMITAHSDSDNTIAAMKLGAVDHLTKPVGRQDVENLLNSVLTATSPGSINRVKRNEPFRERIIGRSEKMRAVLKMIGRLAASEASVLLTGETGTGKEVVARAIHENGSRARGPFVAVNCAAIPEALLESELFGHVRGAFTGASDKRVGSFQMANGGTLLLDEIGDMNIGLQAKILRAVQERQISLVGSAAPLNIDVRIIAATHQDLGEMVNRKLFREDLLYRLSVVELRLPPLRERSEDIEELCQFLLRDMDRHARITPEAMRLLISHSWPGNVRELKNVIERATILSNGRLITEKEIQFTSSRMNSGFRRAKSADWHQTIAEVEKELLINALKTANWNRSEAARRLGIQRQLLYAKMKEHEINEGDRFSSNSSV